MDKTLKNTLIIGGVILGGFGIYKIGKYIKRKRLSHQKGVDALKDKVNKTRLSYDDSWYTRKADEIYTAMKGWGTDTSKVFDVLKALKNNDDWIKLRAEFDVKDDKSLTDYLRDELEEIYFNEITKANEILDKIGGELI